MILSFNQFEVFSGFIFFDNQPYEKVIAKGKTTKMIMFANFLGISAWTCEVRTPQIINSILFLKLHL
ncbi:MAG TPA: hypothetical protein DCF33_04710 [Saprospirales bacterium]|nr:hypothetical protein [Saprospirales bacterium]